MSRPESLFPLFGDLTKLAGVGPKTAKLLAGMGVEKPRDLAYTLPNAVINRTPIATIKGVVLPATVTVEVTVGRHIPNQVKGRPYRVEVRDAEESFTLVFFHARADWLQKQLPSGQVRLISGKLELFDHTAQMVHPDFIELPVHAGRIPEAEPIYPLTQGVTQKTMQKAARAAEALLPDLPEWVDANLLAREGWKSWRGAMAEAHAPQNLSDVSLQSAARTRLAYDEFFAHQLTLAIARRSHRRAKGVVSRGTGKHKNAILQALPFKPTGAQLRAGEEIDQDLAAPQRMNRLLQGDVGAGKTLVALLALATVIEAGGQGVMMAPTEILARQHLAGLKPLAEAAGIVIEILTGRDKGAERAAKLKALKNGDIHILIGTHAVFQADVHFKDLRLAVIDEQHRFGVRQRMELGAKGTAVDVLVMTATPIPRSLALSQYGDMDVSVLDEKPAGRKPVETVLISASRLDAVVERLRAATQAGKQAFWVCPLVDESEVVDFTAAQERYRALRVALGEDQVGLVHGQMPPAEKDAAMAAFVAGETKVLVATTVIEVGVDVPNASIMVIEGAENFGLAQLHQLRGRVGRGAEKSSCLMIYGRLSEAGKTRLETMRRTEDGFEIAEVDLALRGAGDVLGVQQSGLPKFRIADAEAQTELMRTASADARLLLEQDPKFETTRGRAAITLLYLMEYDQSISMISVA